MQFLVITHFFLLPFSLSLSLVFFLFVFFGGWGEGKHTAAWSVSYPGLLAKFVNNQRIKKKLFDDCILFDVILYKMSWFIEIFQV